MSCCGKKKKGLKPKELTQKRRLEFKTVKKTFKNGKRR